MVIKASSRKQVDALLKDLAAEDAAGREGAIARLTLVGERAVGPLMSLAEDGANRPAVRAGALRVLEAIGDARVLATAARVVEDPDPAIAIPAIGVLRAFLRGRHSARALESLTRVAVDRRQPDEIRLAVVGALGDLEAATLKPLFTLLQDDPSDAVRAAIRTPGTAPVAARSNAARLKAAGEAGVLEDPRAIQQAIVRAGGRATLARLRALIERVREREAVEAGERRAQWMLVRATAHGALARRGSRIALYDLRETLESASEPLPVEFLTVLTAVGDVSCLEAIAAAYARVDDAWWRSRLADVFRTIVARDRVSRRHAVMKKILKRWPEILVVGR